MAQRIVQENEIGASVLPLWIEHAAIGIDLEQILVPSFIYAQIASAESGSGERSKGESGDLTQLCRQCVRIGARAGSDQARRLYRNP